MRKRGNKLKRQREEREIYPEELVDLHHRIPDRLPPTASVPSQIRRKNCDEASNVETHEALRMFRHLRIVAQPAIGIVITQD